MTPKAFLGLGVLFALWAMVGALTYGGAQAPAAQEGDPVLAAVGDIACRPGDSSPEHGCQQHATAGLVASQHPDAVAPLGDNQYESGLLSEFDGVGAYNDTWGQFNPIVHPEVGNHEYAASPTAHDYFSYFGAAAGNGVYSYELGTWHIIALNSNCSDIRCEDSLAGSVSSAEVSWLRSDLAAHGNQCILAYWHHPLFTSGWVGNSLGVAPLWNALYAAHADVVVNGHDHMYERFAQQDPSGTATSQGIREFVVGTGGESLFPVGVRQANLQALDDKHFGALFLTLHPSGYDWTFRASDMTVLDSGSTACHAQPVIPGTPIPPPPGSPTPVPAGPAPAGPVTPVPPPPAPRARLTFAVRVQRASPRAILKSGLITHVYCSRACDLRIAIRMSLDHLRTTVLHYKETEQQISRPHSLLHLHLPGASLRNLFRARLRFTFVATDASREVRRISITLRLH